MIMEEINRRNQPALIPTHPTEAIIPLKAPSTTKPYSPCDGAARQLYSGFPQTQAFPIDYSLPRKNKGNNNSQCDLPLDNQTTQEVTNDANVYEDGCNNHVLTNPRFINVSRPVMYEHSSGDNNHVGNYGLKHLYQFQQMYSYPTTLYSQAHLGYHPSNERTRQKTNSTHGSGTYCYSVANHNNFSPAYNPNKSFAIYEKNKPVFQHRNAKIFPKTTHIKTDNDTNLQSFDSYGKNKPMFQHSNRTLLPIKKENDANLQSASKDENQINLSMQYISTQANISSSSLIPAQEPLLKYENDWQQRLSQCSQQWHLDSTPKASSARDSNPSFSSQSSIESCSQKSPSKHKTLSLDSLAMSPRKKPRTSSEVVNLHLYRSPVFTCEMTQVQKFLMIEKAQSEALMKLNFPDPITNVYNPLEYAWEPHTNYVSKYCHTEKDVLFLGMNPGPFGMAQNGVPFGENDHVVNWLKISGRVNKPSNEHPRRPITGFKCQRTEVSGSRFWRFWKKMCQTPENFFHRTFVHNIFPLVFMSQSGKNVTPPQIPIETRQQINFISDEAIRDIVKVLRVKMVVGIGKFAHERAKSALLNLESFQDVQIGIIMHPSPCNPTANKGWEGIVTRQLNDLGLLDFFGCRNEVNLVAEISGDSEQLISANPSHAAYYYNSKIAT